MSAPEVTQLLQQWRQGDQDALQRLTPVVYRELRRLASYYMHHERSGHTLQATALVNEAFLQLLGKPAAVDWQNRAHFVAVASRLMRQILVGYARAHNADKRGGGQARLALDACFDIATAEPDLDLVALDDALEQLATIAPERCRVVELRYFGGLTIEETAEVLGISAATVKRQWALARAWLENALKPPPPTPTQ